MKQLFTMLATGALMASAATTANARYWTYDFSAPVQATSIKADHWYCLQCGTSAFNGAYSSFLSGESIKTATNLSSENLYKFVETGEKTDDGTLSYYVLNYEGNYLYGPGQKKFFGDAIDRAWKVTVKNSKVWNANYTYTTSDGEFTGLEAYIQEAYDDGVAFDLSNVTKCEMENTVVIANNEPEDASDPRSTYVYLCGLDNDVRSGTASRATDYDTNSWVLYEVTELSAQMSLEAMLNEISNATFTMDLSDYPVGTGVGEFDASLRDAFMNIWNKAIDIYRGATTATEAEIDAIIEELPAAYNAFCLSGKGFAEGYYIFYNCRATGYEETAWPWVDNYNDYGHDGGAMYDGAAIKPSDLKLRWSIYPDDADAQNIFIDKDENGKAVVTDSEGNLTDENGIPYQLCANTAKYVWHVTQSNQKDKEGNPLFYLQNIVTENYVGSAETSDYCVNMTGDAVNAYALKPNLYVPGWFSLYCPDLPVYADVTAPSEATYSGLHADKWSDSVTYWDDRNAGSSWRVISLREADYETLVKNVASEKIMTNLKAVVKKAENSLIKAYTYDIFNADGTKNTTAESASLEVDGLLTDGSTMSSEASDTSYGSFNDLFDGDENTFWATHYWDWNDTYKGDPYFQFILDAEEIALHFKTVMYEDWYSGWFYGDYDAPLTFDIYATEDDALLSLVTVDGNDKGWENLWTRVGSYEFDYQYTSANGGWDNNVGTCSAFFDKGYKNFRLVFKERVTEYSGVYYAMSEFRVHRVSIDYENSLINAVPKDIVTRLEAALKAANDEITAGVATRETYEELVEAYAAFLEHYPDPERITDAVADAQSLVNAAVEGEGLGYYDAGAKAKLQTAIKTAEAGVKEMMTVEEINAILTALNAALAEFNAALHVPSTGLYVIKSKTETAALAGRSIAAQTSSETEAVPLVGRVADGDRYADEANAALRPTIYWQVEAVDGGFTAKNVYTGKYLAPISGKTTLSQRSEAYVFNIQYAKAPGCFNLVIDKSDAKSGSYIYVAASESQVALKTTDSASGADNSAFEFLLQDESEVNSAMNDGGLLFDIDYPTAPQLFTFTVDMDAYVDGDAGAFYTVIGQDADYNIQLRKEEGTLEAGQAYVYVPTTGVGQSKVLFFMPEGAMLTALTPTSKGKSQNGLNGIFETLTLADGCGVFNTNHTKVLISEAGETVRANTGYFSLMPVATEAGDAMIPANGMIADLEGIENLNIITLEKQGIYTISGLRLRDANRLPAGLYIIDGKKMMVK